MVEPPAEVWSYAYDAFGRETSVVISSNEPAAPARVFSTTYDSQGRVVRRETPEGVLSYDYDTLDRVVAVHVGEADDPERSTFFTYDAFGRLSEVAEQTGGEASLAIHRYEYDAEGRLSLERQANGVVVEHGYDAFGRLTKLTHYAPDETPETLADNDELFEFADEFRADGKRIRSTETDFTDETPQVVNLTFHYDALGRLTEEDSDSEDDATDYTATYTFDLNSNRLQKDVDQDRDGDIDETTTSTFDVNDRLLTESLTRAGDVSPLATTYGYDHTQQTGQTTTQNGVVTRLQTFAYDLAGRMSGVEIEQYSDGVLTSQSSTTYGFNAENIRTSATTQVDESGDGDFETDRHSEFLIDGRNLTGYQQVLRETITDVSTGQVRTTTDYVFGYDALSQTVTAYDAFGAVAGQSTQWFGHDGRGSVRALFDAAGAVAQINGVDQHFAYDAYGNPIGFSLTTAATSLLYSGEWTDRLTGDQNLRARVYNPTTGRFFSLDPYSGNANHPQSYHKYLYANGDPINGSDPTGLFTSFNGYEAESQIQRIYAEELRYSPTEPFTLPSGRIRDTVTFGKWSFIGDNFKLKPDIVNHRERTFLEIKPLTASGVASGFDQMLLYASSLGAAGYRPESEWNPVDREIIVGGLPATFFNVGGLVLYTDLQGVAIEGLLYSVIGAAHNGAFTRSALAELGRLVGRRMLNGLGRQVALQSAKNLIRIGTFASASRIEAKPAVIPIGGVGIVAG